MQNLPTTGMFIDFYEPAYNAVILSDYEFRLDSIYEVQEGTPAVLTIQTQDNSIKISLPFDYKKHFTIPQVISKASRSVSLEPISKLLNPGFTLKPGSYKLFIVAQGNNSTLKSREHKFEISAISRELCPKAVYGT